MINKQAVGCEYPRCNKQETWDHVVWCKEMKQFRCKFVTVLFQELMKKKLSQICYEELFYLTKDILIYLEQGHEDKHVAHQHLIEMRCLFCGFIVKS